MLTVASPEKKAENVVKSGAPSENIVQNHLNIALFNVFSIWRVDTGIFLSPKKFFICSDFLAEILVIQKL